VTYFDDIDPNSHCCKTVPTHHGYPLSLSIVDSGTYTADSIEFIYSAWLVHRLSEDSLVYFVELSCS